MEYLFVASAAITVFILSLILGKDHKVVADFILCGILLTLFTNLVSLFLLNQTVHPFPTWKEAIFEFSEASIFLYGPLLWLYTRSLTEANFAVRTASMIHFLPFLFALGYFFGGIMHWVTVTDGLRNIILILKLSSVMGYTIHTLSLLRKHQIKIELIFSNLDRKKLTWLSLLCWSILAIGCIAVFSLAVDRFTSLTIPQYGGAFTNVALCVFVYVIGYFGFKQEFIFHSSSQSPIVKEKYEKSGFNPEKKDESFQKVKDYMINAKPYLDPDLTLFSLADQLDLTPNHLSQIINSTSGSNFYDFINRYRVEEAKRQIASDKVNKMTLLGIGLSSGFSSKSTFNRAFKKHTGINPSDFKNKRSGISNH